MDSPLIFSTIPCVIKNALQRAYFLHLILHSPPIEEVGVVGENLELTMVRGVGSYLYQICYSNRRKYVTKKFAICIEFQKKYCGF